jgi:putative DNA primase/helicase
MNGETIEGRFAGANPAAADGTAWAERTPLLPALPEAPSLPPDLIPDSLRPWLVDIAERAQIPQEFVAAPAIVALSSVIGRNVGIYPKRHDDWLVVPNLWGATIGRPGVLKTPAVAEAVKPLLRLAKTSQAKHEAAMAANEAKREIIKVKIAAQKDKAKKAVGKDEDTTAIQATLADLKAALADATPHERRHVAHDATVEKLGELLGQNPRGLLLIRDELSGLLRTLDKPGREGDREFYLEAWNGTGSYTYDRIGRGTTHIDALTLSVIGTIQPGKLQGYVANALSGGAGDDGLLQRIQLAVWPDQQGEWVNIDRWPDTDAKNRAFEVFQALDTMDGAMVANATDGGIPALHFSDEAQQLFDAWRADLEQRLRAPGMILTPAFESHLAKYRSLMPSLALIFYLVEAVVTGEIQAVDLAATRRAADWCDYLEAHARKIYAAELQPDITAAHALVSKIEAGAIQDGTTRRDIYRSHWTGLSTPETVSSGLGLLEKHHWLRLVEEKQEGRGRPSEVILLHPELRRVAA